MIFPRLLQLNSDFENDMIIPGFKGRKAGRACTPRLLNLGSAGMTHEGSFCLMTVKKTAASTPLWGEKPYRSLDYEWKKQYGEKIYKVSLNGGMTCPNRDGTVGKGGCIFCSAGGSGDFAADARLSIKEQIESQEKKLRTKFPAKHFVAYFQAYTNTYAPVEYLKDLFTEAISHPDIVALSIGTRPDCLPPEILELLSSLNQIKPVTVELGLQTIHERTAAFIRRGYPLPCFEKAVRELRDRGISVVVHTILGLPGETEEDILATIRYLNHQDIQGIKLQLLHVLKGTDLAAWYEDPGFPVFTEEQYVDLVIRCIEELSPKITIHRLTGDGPKELLIAPLWSSRKRSVLNEIHRQLKLRGSWQGKSFLS